MWTGILLLEGYTAKLLLSFDLTIPFEMLQHDNKKAEILSITQPTTSLPHQHFEVGSGVKINEIMSRELNQYVEPLLISERE